MGAGKKIDKHAGKKIDKRTAGVLKRSQALPGYNIICKKNA